MYPRDHNKIKEIKNNNKKKDLLKIRDITMKIRRSTMMRNLNKEKKEQTVKKK